MIMAVSGGDLTSALITPLKFGRLIVSKGIPAANGDTFKESNALYTSYAIKTLRIID